MERVPRPFDLASRASKALASLASLAALVVLAARAARLPRVTLLALVLGALPAPAAWADEPPLGGARVPKVVHQRYLLEDGRALDFAGARVAEGWKDYTGVLGLGFGRDAFWVRISLEGLQPGAPWVVRLRPAFLDDVELFLPTPDGGHRTMRLGDRKPEPREGTPDGALAVDWTPGEGQTQAELFLRVSTSSTRSAQVVVLPLNEAEWQRGIENGLAGLFFGMMLCLLAWGSLSAVVRRDAVLAWYAAYQLAGCAMSAGLMGYARLLLPESSTVSPDLWTSVSVLSITAVASVFHLTFLRSVIGGARLPLSLRVLLSLCIVGAFVNLALYAAGLRFLALAINAKLVTATSVLLALVVVLEALRQRDSPLRPVLVAYSVQCVVVFVTLLPLVGIVNIDGWLQFGTSIHTLLVGVVLAGVLLIRRVEAEREADRIRQGLKVEQIRAERAVAERDEKDRFLSMLTHELRTPLSVIRMVLDGARRRGAEPAVHRQVDLARTAVLDIDLVIERTVQVDRLERRVLEASRAVCDLGEVLALCVNAIGSPLSDRIRLEKPAEPLQVLSDPVLLRMIMANLLDNALKYSAPDSPVDVRVASEGTGGGRWRVEVTNTPGRAGRPDAQRVFSKYYRSEGAQHSTGSGQGLYLVDGLARHLGLEIVCRPGHSNDPVTFELRSQG